MKIMETPKSMSVTSEIRGIKQYNCIFTIILMYSVEKKKIQKMSWMCSTRLWKMCILSGYGSVWRTWKKETKLHDS